MESDTLVCNSGSITYELCDLGQIIEVFWASVSSYVKIVTIIPLAIYGSSWHIGGTQDMLVFPFLSCPTGLCRKDTGDPIVHSLP